MNAQTLSAQWRAEEGDFLAERRRIVGLSLLAAAAMGAVTLYQTGLVKHLPEPPLPYLNAEKVDASPEAYNRVGSATPDAALGLVSYAATVMLATMAGMDRARQYPLIPLVLAGKVTVDAVNAGYLTWEQIAKHKALCSYCLVAAAASLAVVPAAWPEARAALKYWRTKRH
ncbi:vitamin K epoxide reductase family protein [Deinococcus peraridilitoris]|uniref:Vitamin K epoxide reductase family protein n=1 Tax=Deinococcus peraridilitoris (strain DSM 19664 / LMG 22246 / CIP 109416 / KR-200) TaxID=937777 RepID=L0A812_DEIPD|nr:vitamin K epoxide reductase family protein [Deinococcus peraridilitoris]AFZ69569.1 vitamin K epoxide reductase family protein [Deinococcus peraridilitoris DSM 19664]